MKSLYIYSAAEQAERLYNQYQEYVVDLDTPDELVERTRDLYYSVLSELVGYGVGGVLINGTFRNLNGVL